MNEIYEKKKLTNMAKAKKPQYIKILCLYKKTINSYKNYKIC